MNALFYLLKSQMKKFNFVHTKKKIDPQKEKKIRKKNLIIYMNKAKATFHEYSVSQKKINLLDNSI